jgi:hypothetical protein
MLLAATAQAELPLGPSGMEVAEPTGARLDLPLPVSEVNNANCPAWPGMCRGTGPGTGGIDGKSLDAPSLFVYTKPALSGFSPSAARLLGFDVATKFKQEFKY